MQANLTLDCISSSESTATGLLNLIWQSRINIQCICTHVHLKTPWPKSLLEGAKGFKTLVTVLFFLFPKSSRYLLRISKLCFSAFLSLLCTCFISEEWISSQSYAFLSLTGMCESPLWCMPAVLVNLQQTTIIKQLMEAFHFPFQPTTRLFFWLYCGETFTRPSF